MPPVIVLEIVPESAEAGITSMKVPGKSPLASDNSTLNSFGEANVPLAV